MSVILFGSIKGGAGKTTLSAQLCAEAVRRGQEIGCSEDLVRDGVNGYVFDSGSQMATLQALDRMWDAREQWASMGKASEDIIGGWGLGRFASGFWSACQRALEPMQSRLTDRIAGAALGAALSVY